MSDRLSSRPLFPFQLVADEVRSLWLISQFSIGFNTVFVGARVLSCPRACSVCNRESL